MKSRKRNHIQILQQEVIIPQVVEQKTEDIFCAIQNGEISREMPLKQVPASKFPRKRAWAAMAAVLAMSTVTVGAATYTKWSRSLEGGLQITDTQKQTLKDNNAWSALNRPKTCEGVTITAKECLVDQYTAFITFKIEGFEMPENGWPWVKKLPKVFIGDEEANTDRNYNYYFDFYDGIIYDEHQNAFRDDGTPMAEEEEHASFIMDDGSLECRMEIIASDKEGLLGKPIYIKLRDLFYTVGRTEEVFDKPRTWEFCWVLEGTKDSRKVTVNEPLGDTGVTITGVEISPISIQTMYSEPQSKDDFEMVPLCIGVRTKDGKVNMGIASHGWTTIISSDEKMKYYKKLNQTKRVIDIEQIDALIYIDEEDEFEFDVGDWEAVTMYTVPIGTQGTEKN